MMTFHYQSISLQKTLMHLHGGVKRPEPPPSPSDAMMSEERKAGTMESGKREINLRPKGISRFREGKRE